MAPAIISGSLSPSQDSRQHPHPNQQLQSQQQSIKTSLPLSPSPPILQPRSVQKISVYVRRLLAVQSYLDATASPYQLGNNSSLSTTSINTSASTGEQSQLQLFQQQPKNSGPFLAPARETNRRLRSGSVSYQDRVSDIGRDEYNYSASASSRPRSRSLASGLAPCSSDSLPKVQAQTLLSLTTPSAHGLATASRPYTGAPRSGSSSAASPCFPPTRCGSTQPTPSSSSPFFGSHFSQLEYQPELPQLSSPMTLSPEAQYPPTTGPRLRKASSATSLSVQTTPSTAQITNVSQHQNRSLAWDLYVQTLPVIASPSRTSRPTTAQPTNTSSHPSNLSPSTIGSRESSMQRPLLAAVRQQQPQRPQHQQPHPPSFPQQPALAVDMMKHYESLLNSPASSTPTINTPEHLILTHSSLSLASPLPHSRSEESTSAHFATATTVSTLAIPSSSLPFPSIPPSVESSSCAVLPLPSSLPSSSSSFPSSSPSESSSFTTTRTASTTSLHLNKTRVLMATTSFNSHTTPSSPSSSSASLSFSPSLLAPVAQSQRRFKYNSRLSTSPPATLLNSQPQLLLPSVLSRQDTYTAENVCQNKAEQDNLGNEEYLRSFYNKRIAHPAMDSTDDTSNQSQHTSLSTTTTTAKSTTSTTSTSPASTISTVFRTNITKRNRDDSLSHTKTDALAASTTASETELGANDKARPDHDNGSEDHNLHTHSYRQGPSMQLTNLEKGKQKRHPRTLMTPRPSKLIIPVPPKNLSFPASSLVHSSDNDENYHYFSFGPSPTVVSASEDCYEQLQWQRQLQHQQVRYGNDVEDGSDELKVRKELIQNHEIERDHAGGKNLGDSHLYNHFEKPLPPLPIFLTLTEATGSTSIAAKEGTESLRSVDPVLSASKIGFRQKLYKRLERRGSSGPESGGGDGNEMVHPLDIFESGHSSISSKDYGNLSRVDESEQLGGVQGKQIERASYNPYFPLSVDQDEDADNNEQELEYHHQPHHSQTSLLYTPWSSEQQLQEQHYRSRFDMESVSLDSFANPKEVWYTHHTTPGKLFSKTRWKFICCTGPGWIRIGKLLITTGFGLFVIMAVSLAALSKIHPTPPPV